MTAFRPIYRARLFAPRSVDGTETTILTPRVGSVHSDPFQVATKKGVAGYQPYLHGGPRGRGSEIEPIEKHSDTGERVWRIMDRRTGTSNLQRWLSAYFGDAKGGNQLLGLLWEVDQSLDNGASFTRFETSRVQAVRRSSGSKTWMDLTGADRTDDLDAEVFVGVVGAAAAGYAHHAQITPLGLMKPYGDFKLVKAIAGKVIMFDNAELFRVEVDKGQADGRRTLYTKTLFDLSEHGAHSAKPARLWISLAGANDFKRYELAWADSRDRGGHNTTSIGSIFARKITGGDAPPALNSLVDFYIDSTELPVSEGLPLLVNDVHPITFLRHLCGGNFGKLTAAGAVTWSVPTDAGIGGSTFDALEADTSIPKVRFRITEKEELRDFAERELLRPFHLAWKLDEFGRVAIVDMRRKSVAAPVAVLTNADLTSSKDAVDWETVKSDAVRSVTAWYYSERQLEIGDDLPNPFSHIPGYGFTDATYPDLPSVLIGDAKDYPIKVADFGPRADDLRGEDIEVEVHGLRFRVGSGTVLSEKQDDQPRADRIAGFLAGIASDMRGPFGLGPTYYELECRRASANVALVKVGSTVTLDINEIPDPATNERGGQRLMLCLSRIEDGPRVRLRGLDWGANSVAVVPVIAAPTLDTVQPATAVDVNVTLNALAQQVKLDYAVTATTVGVRPVAVSALWRHGKQLTATGLAELKDLRRGGNRRVWIRGRSEPAAGQGFSLVSDWAFPSTGPGYVDLAAVNPPTGLVVNSPSGSIATASWTVGDATSMVEVFILAGAVAPTGLPEERVGTVLRPGSDEVEIAGRTIGGAQYTVGVRHVDQIGNVSVMVSFTFVAGATTQLQAPRNPDGFSASTLTSFGIYGLVVIASEFPSNVEFEEAVETAPASGAYGAFARVDTKESVAGDWTRWTGYAARDRKRRKLRARHVRDGANASVYTAEVIVTPWTNDAIAEYPIGAPSARITKVAIGSHRALEILSLEGALGANATALQWRYRVGTAAWTAYSSDPLPVQITVSRNPEYATPVVFETLQSDGGTANAAHSVAARLETGAPGPREDLLRGGRAGLPIRDKVFTTEPVYDRDGSLPLVDPVLRRLTVNLFGPNGTHPMDVVETGGGRGYGGFSSLLGDLVSTARDSRSALLNNHFRYATDGADGVVENSLRNFMHGSYIDASRRPITIRNATLARDVVANDIDVGQDRARGGFTNLTGALVSTSVDSRAALLNNHFRYATDGAAGVVESADRSFILQSFVDGSRRPTQLRDATQQLDVSGYNINRGQLSARRGTFARAVSGEDNARSGLAGLPTTPAAAFLTQPLYDRGGATPLIDTSTREVLSGLALGSGVRGAADVVFGGAIKYAPNRHNEAGSGAHGTSVVFGTSFDQVPELRILPQTYRVPTVGNTVEFKTFDATTDGASIRAVEITGAVSTPQSDDFAATLNGTPSGAGITIGAPSSEAFCNLADANTTSTTYKVYFDVDTTAKVGAGLTRVTAYKNAAVGGTVWTQVGLKSYDDGVDLTGESIEFTAVLDPNYDVRIVVTYSGGTPSTNATVVADRVDYNVITGSSEFAITNVAGGSALLQAVEKS